MRHRGHEWPVAQGGATAGNAGARFGKVTSMLFSRKPERRNDPSAPSTVPPPLAPAGALAPPPATQSPERDGGARPHSFIDGSLTIIGDLYSEGDVHLDGHICGNVRCAQLIVGRDAVITGAITAEQAIVRGRITGTIRSPVVILQDTARVQSEIIYTTLAVDDGATFEGAAHRSDNPLREDEPASPLTDLERIMLATGYSNATSRSEANGFDRRCATATGAPSAAPAPPPGDGRDGR
jgi:cytoskeletal protein CcmA (bactofilin family)